MSTSQLNVRISPEEHRILEDLASQTDGILSKAAVVRVLIRYAKASGWDPLDKGSTLAERPAKEGREASTSSSSTKKRTTKSSSLEVQPPLHAHEDLIRDFWKSKAGSKSAAGWKLLMAELLKIQEKYGDRVVREQLELAAANRWKGVSLRNYEQFGIKSGAAQGQKSLDQLAAEMDAMPRLW